MNLPNRVVVTILSVVLTLSTGTVDHKTSEAPGPGAPESLSQTTTTAVTTGFAGSFRKDSGPNIIVVLTDDQDLRLYSMDFMPQVQGHLANAGMTLSNFYVPLPLCCPSRVTLLRGQYAHNHDVVGNLPPTGGFHKAYASGVENATVATALHQRGYRTALIGKYLNGYPLPENPTYIPPGWDEWFSPTNDAAYNSYNYTVNDDGVIRHYGGTPADYISDVLAHEAISFIERTVLTQPGTPFFLELAFYAPHAPANPAPRHANRFPRIQAPRTPSFNEADMSDKPVWMQTLPPLTETQMASIDTLYRRKMQSLQAVDEAVAHVMQTLAQMGQLDNTYIFYTSDNGFHLGHHRLLLGKGRAYEEDIAVPFIVRGPGVAPGTTQPALASMIDLAPTIADLAGAEMAVPVDGRSLVPLFHSAQPPPAWRKSLLTENYPVPTGQLPSRSDNLEPPDASDIQLRLHSNEAPTYAALRTAEYKYIEHNGTTREFYDLINDPYELHNEYLNAAPDFIAQLSALLATYKVCAGSGCRAVDSLSPPPLPLIQQPRQYIPSIRAR